MTPILILALLLGQQFRVEDPVAHDTDATIALTDVTKYKLSDYYDFIAHSFGKPGDRSKVRAEDVNTLGEVMDSTWFQNRHGAFPMSVEALVRGPNSGSGPSMDRAWEVIAMKTEGVTPGFRIRDSVGNVYFVKFDPASHPELATAAELIATKVFYAIGYNVPENYLAFFSRDQIKVEANATLVDHGRERRMTEHDLDAVLKRVYRAPDGRYRAIASKMLEGTPVGPFQYFGTRLDDPNDVIPHEHRRELRGLRVFSAWLNHTDSRAINSLDMMVSNDGRWHLKHFLIDFGSTLGSRGTGSKTPSSGWEYSWDPKPALGRIVTLGIWDRDWVHAKYPHDPSIGRFESQRFNPKEWRPSYPNPAFDNMADEDAYWAAKIVMSFTDEDIRAVVNSALLSDPAAETYLTQTLIERRDKVGKAWLSTLSSFDDFELTTDGDLRFDHLASTYDFKPCPEFRVEWFKFDNATGERTAIREFGPGQDDGYFVAAISSNEGVVDVYVRNSLGTARVVGVRRERKAAQ